MAFKHNEDVKKIARIVHNAAIVSIRSAIFSDEFYARNPREDIGAAMRTAYEVRKLMQDEAAKGLLG